MGPSDASRVMEVATQWNYKHKHEFLLISNTPFIEFEHLNTSSNNASLRELYENLFVITPLVPTDLPETQAVSDTTIEDAIACLFHGLNLDFSAALNSVNYHTFIPNLHSSTFRFKNRTFSFDQNNERIFNYALYNFDENTDSFVRSLVIEQDSSLGIWKRDTIRDVGHVVSPDECFKGLNCNTQTGEY